MGAKKVVFLRWIWYNFQRILKSLERDTMLNSLLEVVNFWNQTTQNVYFAINYTLVVLMAVAGLAAIILVMLQPGNSQGIDALGGTSETFYGKNKGRSIESKLKMWTIISLAVLAVLAIVFFILQIPAIWGPVE